MGFPSSGLCVFCIVGPDFLASLVRGWPGGLLCACFLADGLEGGVPEQAQMVEASRVGPVPSERLNLQTSQPVAPAPQNKWDFNSIRVRLLWPPHGRNYWTYPPPSWNTPARPVPDPHTDTGVVLHIAEFLHSLASQSCFTLSLVFCSLSAAALLSLSLHHTTPFLFLSLFLFSWGVVELNPHISPVLQRFLLLISIIVRKIVSNCAQIGLSMNSNISHQMIWDDLHAHFISLNSQNEQKHFPLGLHWQPMETIKNRLANSLWRRKILLLLR